MIDYGIPYTWNNYTIEFTVRDLTVPKGFVGAIYKFEMILAFGKGDLRLWPPEGIPERGRTKVVLQIKIGYDRPIQFGDPTYQQDGENVIVTLPFETTNNPLSSGAQLNSLCDFSPEMMIFGIFDFASSEIVQGFIMAGAQASFGLAVKSALTGNLPMVAIALTATDIMLVYLIVAKVYQEQRTSGNIIGFEFPIVLGVIVLISLMTKRKCIKS